MPSRNERDDVEWDFSFVGGPVRDRRVDARADGEATGDEIDWDFSFVGEPRTSGTASPQSQPASDGDDMDWDFSFVGEPRTSGAATRAVDPAAGDAEVEWDFSFVTDDEPVPGDEPPPRDEPARATELAAAVASQLTDEVPTVVATPAADYFVVDDESASADTPSEPPANPVASSDEIERVEGSLTDQLDRPSLLDDLGVDEPLPEPPPAEALDPTPIVSKVPVHVPAEVPVEDPVKVLTICTHNRTRSVMMMALLQAGFDRSVGEGRVMVRSLGFGPEGEEPIADAVDEMTSRGLDVTAHRSLQVTGPRVQPADLILTAERDHVAKIAEASPDAFRRTFTLPEFCQAIAHDPVPGSRSLREWLHSMSSSRSPATYLAGEVAEVDDPTGSPKRQFAAATETIEAMCDTVVDLLEVSVGRPNWRDSTADQG